jgi:hypothetical protein
VESSEDFLLRKFYNYVSFAGYTDYMGKDLELWRAMLARTISRFLSYLQGSEAPEEMPVVEDISRNSASTRGMAEAQSYYHRGFLLVRILGIIKYLRDSFLNLADSGIHPPGEQEKARLLIWRYFDKFEIGFMNEWVNLELGSQKMLDASAPQLLRSKNKLPCNTVTTDQQSSPPGAVKSELY